MSDRIRLEIPRWALGALVGLATAVVALLGVIIWLVTVDGSGQGDEAAKGNETTAGEFTAAGQITLISADVERNSGECYGTDGYEDMRAGTQVVIRDRDGTTVGVGALDRGEPDDTVTCVFPFEVDDIPEDQGPYSVEVGHRGEIAFSEADAVNLALSLG